MKPVTLALAGSLLAAPVLAHEAPSGWRYPLECCSNQDCREISAKSVIEEPIGFTVLIDGRQFFVERSRARISPDGRYHECHMPGAAELLCFFYPPPAT